MTRKELKEKFRERLNSGVLYTEESNRKFNEWRTNELIKILEREGKLSEKKKKEIEKAAK